MRTEVRRWPLCCLGAAAVLLAIGIDTPSLAAESQLAQLDGSSSPTREPQPPIAGGVPFLIRFTGTVRGLQPGSPVEVQGIRIGDVLSVAVEYAADSNKFVVPVKIELQPGLFPAAGPHPHNAEETYAAADALVRRGLRAQVSSTPFLGGDTGVTLDFKPDAPPAILDRTGPIPELPPGPTRSDMIAEKLQPLLAEIRGLVEELSGAARSMRLLAEYLERRPDALIRGKSEARP